MAVWTTALGLFMSPRSRKIAIYGVLGVILASIIGLGYLNYRGLQENVVELREQHVTLQNALDEANRAVEQAAGAGAAAVEACNAAAAGMGGAADCALAVAD